MGCRSITKRLPRYVQGLLPAADARSIADHMLTCSHCHAEMAQIKKVWAALGELPAPDGAATLFPRVLDRIESCKQKRVRRAWMSLLRPSFAGAAAAIMLICFVSGALMSSVYATGNPQEQAADDLAYSELLADGPQASFFDLYLQTSGQNNEENSL